MTGKELIEYIKKEGLENYRLGILGQAPTTPDGFVGPAPLKDLESSDIHYFKDHGVTVKQLYEVAKEAGAENYEIKIWLPDGITRYSAWIDCIEHGEEIITMATIQVNE